LRIGAEYTIPNSGLRLRAGYVFDPFPYTPDDLNITSERKFFTLGLGMMMEDIVSIDLAYIRGSWRDSTADEIIKKDQKINRIFLSAGYKF